MHSYLKTVGFSQITRRSEIKEIIRDVIASYDEKVCVENHPEGVFVQFSKNYGCDCGITVCGQYDEDNEFHVEYSFPFFRGTGITSQESVVVERHAEKESYAGACDDMRLGVTLIFYLQNPAEYMLEKYKGNVREGQPLTITGLAREGKILFPVQKDKEAVKVEAETAKVETKKVEPVKVETKKVEPAKVETTKTEPVKVETKKVDAVKVETSKTEPVKVETKKVEPVKVETTKTEPLKA